MAAARYNDFAKNDTPFGVVVLADGFYLLSGLLNVILYKYTRPYLLPHSYNSGNHSFALHSDLTPSQNNLPGSTDGHGIQGDLSPSEPKSDDLPYAIQEIVHRQGTASHLASEPRSSIYDEI